MASGDPHKDACTNEVEVYLTIFHHLAAPLFVTNHFDLHLPAPQASPPPPSARVTAPPEGAPPAAAPSEAEKGDALQGEAVGSCLPGSTRRTAFCSCGYRTPVVRGSTEAPTSLLSSFASRPTHFGFHNSERLPSRFFAGPRPQPPATASPSCLKSPPPSPLASSFFVSSAGFAWTMREDEVKDEVGRRVAYRLLLTTELLASVSTSTTSGSSSGSSEGEDDGDEDYIQQGSSSVASLRPVIVALVLTFPPCGVYLRFLRHHPALLVRLLRQVTHFAYQLIPQFYRVLASKSGSLKGTVDRRILAVASALEKEPFVVKTWRALKREVRATFSFSKPISATLDAPPHLLLLSSKDRFLQKNPAASMLRTAMMVLLKSDESFFSAAVGGLISCCDFTRSDSSLPRATLPSPQVLPSKKSRVIILTLDAELGEALLLVATAFLRGQGRDRGDGGVGEARRGSRGSKKKPLSLVEEEEGPFSDSSHLSRFEAAYAAMNECTFVSKKRGLSPIDNGLIIQWLPMLYSRELEAKLPSPFNEEDYLLLLCPELSISRRLFLQRRTEIAQLNVYPNSRHIHYFTPFSCSIGAAVNIGCDSSLLAALRSIMAVHCSSSSKRFNITIGDHRDYEDGGIDDDSDGDSELLASFDYLLAWLRDCAVETHYSAATTVAAADMTLSPSPSPAPSSPSSSTPTALRKKDWFSDLCQKVYGSVSFSSASSLPVEPPAKEARCSGASSDDGVSSLPPHSPYRTHAVPPIPIGSSLLQLVLS